MDSTYLLSILAIVLIMFIAGGAYLFARKHSRAQREDSRGGTGAGESAAHS
jgi:hypothetical protein